MEHWWASQNELISLLNLTHVNGIGPARLRHLIKVFQYPSKILSVSARDLTAFGGINQTLAEAIFLAQRDNYGASQLELVKKFKTRLLTFWDAAYPPRLKNIADPPVVLFVNGNHEILNDFALAIVGTRVPTAYGKQVTIQMTNELVAAGITIVSGLARGIDTISHLETVKNGGKTVAVLGSGLDQIYPAENKKLAQEICKKGAVISEFAFGSKPDAMNFPRRNRIISGLSAGTLVTEAGEKSGALITAYQAVEQNREVFAIPGNIFSPKCAGPNRLIKEGAKLVTSIDDIFAELPQQVDLFARPKIQQKMMREFSSAEKEIIAVLRAGEKHIDKLSRQLKKSTPLLLSTLLKLELDGVVRQQPGQIFLLNKSF